MSIQLSYATLNIRYSVCNIIISVVIAEWQVETMYLPLKNPTAYIRLNCDTTMPGDGLHIHDNYLRLTTTNVCSFRRANDSHNSAIIYRADDHWWFSNICATYRVGWVVLFTMFFADGKCPGTTRICSEGQCYRNSEKSCVSECDICCCLTWFDLPFAINSTSTQLVKVAENHQHHGFLGLSVSNLTVDPNHC